VRWSATRLGDYRGRVRRRRSARGGGYGGLLPLHQRKRLIGARERGRRLGDGHCGAETAERTPRSRRPGRLGRAGQDGTTTQPGPRRPAGGAACRTRPGSRRSEAPSPGRQAVAVRQLHGGVWVRKGLRGGPERGGVWRRPGRWTRLPRGPRGRARGQAGCEARRPATRFKSGSVLPTLRQRWPTRVQHKSCRILRSDKRLLHRMCCG
jgi:hypothetical protein